MKKAKILMNKPVCLELSILELSIILMYEFWYDYVKRKYGERVELYHMDTVSFIVYIKNRWYLYEDVAEDVETRFDTSNYELDRPLPRRKNKNVIGLMKDELEQNEQTSARSYSYLIADGSEDKKAKDTKSVS